MLASIILDFEESEGVELVSIWRTHIPGLGTTAICVIPYNEDISRSGKKPEIFLVVECYVNNNES